MHGFTRSSKKLNSDNSLVAQLHSISDFELIGELGRGSCGIVHRGKRKRDGKVFVCKEVVVDDTDAKQQTQALRETQLMKQIRNPNIAEYVDAFMEGGTLWIIMQLYEGGDLKAYLAANPKPVPERTTWRFFLRMVLGLDYLHTRRILHRDMKSANVFLVGEGEKLRIGDLGLARMLGNTMCGASTFCGSPKYMSPEEASGDTYYDDKGDVWALGVILYEICSDNHVLPFDAKSLKGLLKKIVEDDPPKLHPRIEAGLLQLCSDLLAKNKDNRPTTCEILSFPSVCHSALKHGLSEEIGSLIAAETNRAIAVTRRTSCPPAKTEPVSRSSSAVQVDHADTLRSRVGILLSGSTEAANGPPFHRFSFCEICAAQGSETNQFTMMNPRHHCRTCGRSICKNHSAIKGANVVFAACRGETQQRTCELCSLHSVSSTTQTYGARRLIMAAGEKFHAWDSRSAAEPEWIVEKRLFFAAMATLPNGKDVLCTVADESKTQIELRSLEKGRTTCIRQLYPDTSAASDVVNASEVSLAACHASWFVFLRQAYEQLASATVMELGKGQCLGRCRVAGRVTALAVYSGKYGFFVTGEDQGKVQIFHVPGKDEYCDLVSVLEGHTDAVMNISIGGALNLSFVCTGSSDHTVRVWRGDIRAKAFQANPQAICEEYRPSDSTSATQSSVCCDGSSLAFVQAASLGSNADQGASLWDMSLGRWERSFFRRGHSVQGVALRGIVLVTCDGFIEGRQGGTIQMWHAPTGTPLSAIVNPEPVFNLLLADIREDQNNLGIQQSRSRSSYDSLGSNG